MSKIEISSPIVRNRCARLLKVARSDSSVTRLEATGLAYTMAVTLSREAKTDGDFSEYRVCRDVALGLESIVLN